jgi:uncharacterized protein YerC
MTLVRSVLKQPTASEPEIMERYKELLSQPGVASALLPVVRAVAAEHDAAAAGTVDSNRLWYSAQQSSDIGVVAAASVQGIFSAVADIARKILADETEESAARKRNEWINRDPEDTAAAVATAAELGTVAKRDKAGLVVLQSYTFEDNSSSSSSSSSTTSSSSSSGSSDSSSELITVKEDVDDNTSISITCCKAALPALLPELNARAKSVKQRLELRELLKQDNSIEISSAKGASAAGGTEEPLSMTTLECLEMLDAIDKDSEDPRGASLQELAKLYSKPDVVEALVPAAERITQNDATSETTVYEAWKAVR